MQYIIYVCNTWNIYKYAYLPLSFIRHFRFCRIIVIYAIKFAVLSEILSNPTYVWSVTILALFYSKYDFHPHMLRMSIKCHTFSILILQRDNKWDLEFPLFFMNRENVDLKENFMIAIKMKWWAFKSEFSVFKYNKSCDKRDLKIYTEKIKKRSRINHWKVYKNEWGRDVYVHLLLYIYLCMYVCVSKWCKYYT